MSMKYNVYLTSENGDGISQQLQDWDGEDILELRCIAFAKDVVISIEPAPITQETDNE